MINDVKLGFKLVRYAHGIKGNIVCGILLMVFGMIIMICSAKISGLGSNAGFLMMIIGMLPTQLLYSLNVTDWVQSSSVRKSLQTKVPVFCTFVTMLAVYLFIVAVKGILVLIFPENQVNACGELVVIAFLTMIVMLYMAGAYKMFWVSTILFFVVYMATFSLVMKSDWIWNLEIFTYGWGSFLLAVLVGIAMMVVAAGVSYVVSLALYKRPVSKMSMPATLRKYM